jgi:hypothetical protein
MIEFEFAPAALARRIVTSALESDVARLHRAIVAAIEIHGSEAAERYVFTRARALAAALGADCRTTVTEAIDSCLHRGGLAPG